MKPMQLLIHTIHTSHVYVVISYHFWFLYDFSQERFPLQVDACRESMNTTFSCPLALPLSALCLQAVIGLPLFIQQIATPFSNGSFLISLGKLYRFTLTVRAKFVLLSRKNFANDGLV